MKKIFATLIMMLMCVMVIAQDVIYSQDLVNKANRGDSQSMIDLGYCYYWGYGVNMDNFEAYRWFKKGADNGDARGMYELGRCYYNGTYVTEDESMAQYWFKKALRIFKTNAEYGDAQAMYYLALSYSYAYGVTKDYDLAFYWAQKGAEKGHFLSMYQLGRCYYSGIGVARDKSQAVSWYKKSAEKGCIKAMTELGDCYRFGFGVIEDKSQAVYWYKKGIESGDGDAMIGLGQSYYYGNGVIKDQSQAVYWYKKAAEKGYSWPMEKLAKCYEKGECGFTQNQSKANILYSANKKSMAGDMNEARQLLYQVFPDLLIKMDPNNPPIIQIVPGSVMFADATGNNAIDANETCSVRFKVKNIGNGAGYDCVAKVKSSTYCITAGEKKIDKISAGETIDIKIPVTSNMNTSNGTTNLAVSVYEPNNFGCDPVTLTVNTKAFVAPMLKIVDYAISNDGGGNLRKMMPFNLQMILQNTQYGNAEDVEVSISLPDNVMVLEGDKLRSFANLSAGGKKDLNYTIIANNAYNASSIPVKVTIKEKYGKYAESRTIDLAMNQQMSAQRIVVDENETAPKGNIEIAQIEGKVKLSDVDQNIPHNATKDDNTFAVIIANENYMQESKVTYALNDGKMFGVYCEEVLGLPKENIRVLKDATLNQIRGGVNWLKKVADAYNGDANLIFYYAGHGVPDESTKDAYMLPVDGYGNDLITAYKMEDLYTKLSSCPSKQTLVFLDACFSGKQRSGKEMATARAVGITTRKTAPKGNMVVFSAAQGDETAYPYKEKQHGMFTYYLLKKLQLTKGNVTLGELGSYIMDNVSRKSVVTNTKSQTPMVQPSSSMINRWKNIKL